MDLSAYISEKEQDGVVNVTKGEGYFVEHTINRVNTHWYMRHELVVITDAPIEIYCLQTRSYVTAQQLEEGIFENTAGMTLLKKFVPYNGVVRIKGMMQNCEYQIKRL